MKELTCNICEESVYLAERGERLEGYETPLEHLKSTGHDPREPPQQRRLACNDCENVWWYTGSADRPTCPNCHGKNVEATDNKEEADK